MITALVVCAALALDAVLGEPRRFHPLVGFAAFAKKVEGWLYRDSVSAGATALVLVLLPVLLLGVIAASLPFPYFALLLDALVLYLAIAWKSLIAHTEQVRAALLGNDLTLAREKVGLIVSRDTRNLDETAVSTAAIESLLENGNDAIFGAIFWYLVAGIPGVLLYRASNTLDAMWGYRNSRYLHFGRAAARLDDVLNWIPARLTALSYAVVGKFTQGLRCWREQGPGWKSSNAGSVMAAGAGSLGLLLGGAAIYDGSVEARPPLGSGRRPTAADIGAAQVLLGRALMLWLALIFAGGWFVAGG